MSEYSLITSVDDYLCAIKNLMNNYPIIKGVYRGQSKVEWKLESSFTRRIKNNNQAKNVTYLNFIDYHVNLLKNAKSRRYHWDGGRKLCDLELLANLQHYSGATCLIDFSFNPLVALWFCCSNHFDDDGQVYMINLYEPDILQKIDLSVVENQSFSDLFCHEESNVWYWDPSPINLRIPYQKSLFIFGFPENMDAFCKKIRIKAESKKEILNILDQYYNINIETLFNDLNGFAGANSCDKPILDSEKNIWLRYALDSYQSSKYQESIIYFLKVLSFDKDDELILEKLGFAYFYNKIS